MKENIKKKKKEVINTYQWIYLRNKLLLLMIEKWKYKANIQIIDNLDSWYPLTCGTCALMSISCAILIPRAAAVLPEAPLQAAS